MSLALLFHYLLLNMFGMLIHPSSGACDLFDELFHGLYCSGSMCVGVALWWCGIRMQAEALLTDIKLVSLYSAIKMMHGPINIIFLSCLTLRFTSYFTRSIYKISLAT